MFVSETVQARQVVFVVYHFGLSVFVCREFHEVLGLLLPEFDTGSLQVPPHLFNLNVAFALRVQKSEGSQDGFRVIRFKLLFLED